MSVLRSHPQTIGLLLVISIVILISVCQNQNQSIDQFNDNFTTFVGEQWWTEEQLEMCDNVDKETLWRRNDSICLTYFHNLLPVDIEIVNWSPALVIYRNLLTPRQKDLFLEYIDKQELVRQKTSDFGKSRETTHRRANGSFIEHGAAQITSEVHRKLQKRIPAVNFQKAELFSALSYLPGGHYSVHYDYLSYSNKGQWDWWMKNMRNRIATLIFVLETAEKGGGTVFPSIGTTIRINAGDAFLWFNTQADESQEMLSNHGGCPIYSGRKVITTLWIRAKDQSITATAPTGTPISAEWLIPGISSQFQSGIQMTSSGDGEKKTKGFFW